MRVINDTHIIRWVHEEGFRQEWEIPVAYNVEHVYRGTKEPDDPSEVHINEMVKVLEDIGPFKIGDMLVLTENERHDLEEDELQNL